MFFLGTDWDREIGGIGFSLLSLTIFNFLIPPPIEEAPVSSEFVLEQDALGREVHLGNIFYGTLDTISTDENLWSKESLENRNIEIFPTQDTIVELSNSQIERFNNLDIEASLALSFIGGLVSVEGSAKYLDTRKIHNL